MASEQKYKMLLVKLHEKTCNNDADWRLDKNEKFACLKLTKNIIVLKESKNDNGEPLEVMIIEDEDGKLIETFSDENLATDMHPRTRGFDNYYLLMCDLRKRAYDRATGADDIIDSILNELDDNVPF